MSFHLSAMGIGLGRLIGCSGMGSYLGFGPEAEIVDSPDDIEIDGVIPEVRFDDIPKTEIDP